MKITNLSTYEYTLYMIKPDDGYKYITDNETWAEQAYMGTLEQTANWHDTNDEPPTNNEKGEI